MKKRMQKAFTLVELMIVLTIIAILAAVAIPAYSDFVIRTKVAELVAAAGALKGRVADNAQQAGNVLANSGVGVAVVPGGKVTGGTVTNDGIITIEGSATSIGTAISIVLTPSMGNDGKIIWTCSSASTVFKFVPSECRH